MFVVLGGIIAGGLAIILLHNMRQMRFYQDLARTQRERDESRGEACAVLYNIGDGVIVTNRESRITRMNPVAERLTGWTETEALGKPLQEVFRIINRETRATVENPAERVLRKNAVMGLPKNTVLVARDGTECPILDSGAPIHGQDETCIGVVLVFHDQTMERAAQRALEESELKYRALFDQARDSILMLEVLPDGPPIIRDANTAALQMRGYSREEIIGKPISFLDAEEDPARIIKERLRLAKAVGGAVFETHHRRKDGTIFTAEAAVKKISIGGKRMLIDISRDTTERRLAAEALHESEGKYRALVETTGTGYVILDREGMVVDANQEYIRLTGHSELRDILGKNVLDWTAEHAKPSNAAAVAQCVKYGRIRDFSIDYMDSNGRITPIDINATVEGKGNSLRIIALCRDITKRKRSEDALRESEARMRAITDSAQDAILMMDPEGRVSYWNPAAEHIFRYTKDEAVGKNLHEFLAPRRYLEAHRAAFAEFRRSGRGAAVGKTLELDAVRKGGEEIKIALSLSAVQLRGEWHALGILRDITERKQQEQELQARNDELTRFTYAVSHDLKSPLVTVKTFLGYLEADIGKQDAAGVAKDLGYIRKAADKMTCLLDELLNLSRVGRKMTAPVEASLQEVVQEALGLVAGRIAARGVEVVVAQERIILCGDKTRLVEVFQNLVDNAVKFMGEQPRPRVEIGAEARGSQTVFFVRDNGIGIDQRHKDKLFGLFEKLNPSTEGTGIGLTLARRIVEVHGGRMWMESEGTGKGASFLFTLANTKRAPAVGKSVRPTGTYGVFDTEDAELPIPQASDQEAAS